MLSKEYLLVFCGCFCTLLANAQIRYSQVRDTTFCIPSVEGLSRPKGVIIRQEIISGYRISTNDPTRGSDEGFVEATRRREIKIRAPLLNKENFKLAIGFKYKVEDSFFEDNESEGNPFYNNLQNKNLRQLGTTLYMVKPFKGNVYFLMRLSVSLNGDFDRPSQATSDYLKYSIAPLVGWKKNQNLTYAVGIAYSENFGRVTVFPLFSYNRTFNERFGVESMLPLKLKLRYSTLNKQNYFYVGSEIQGSTYNVTFQNGDSGYLNNTEIRHFITYEREIYDFVWFGLEAGVRSNLNFSLSDTPNRRISTVVDNSLSQSFYYGFSIFLVPPRNFMSGH